MIVSGIYCKVIKPVLFLFPPDAVHWVVVKVGKIAGCIPGIAPVLEYFFSYKNKSLEQTFFGITFPNPVGLAGGFDKNAELIRIAPSFGFGFMEVGSITNRPYAGNKRPWSVRLPKDESLIINYGLKNKGADVLRKVIARVPRKIPLIVNIAKTNDAQISGQATIADYLASYQKLKSLADMVTINISCPNSGDGVLLCEDLQLLEGLLKGLQDIANGKPILLKIKPDLSKERIRDLVEVVRRYPCIKGYVISNLSKNRSLLSESSRLKGELYLGGISGKPVRDISTAMIREVRKLAGKDYLIVGCGGVFTADHAYEKLQAGANLIELITGCIYRGPTTVKEINEGLAKLPPFLPQ